MILRSRTTVKANLSAMMLEAGIHMSVYNAESPLMLEFTRLFVLLRQYNAESPLMLEFTRLFVLLKGNTMLKVR